MLKSAKQARTTFFLSGAFIVASFALSLTVGAAPWPAVLMVAAIVCMGLATSWYIAHPIRRQP